MSYWYEFSCDFVTIEYGRYEAVRFIGNSGFPRSKNAFVRATEYTWTPVLAGPQPA